MEVLYFFVLILTVLVLAYNRVPLLMAFLIKVAVTGCVSMGLEPITRIHPASGNSSMALPMAPLPMAF